MEIHDAARRGFEREADAYERGRPEYPPAAVDWLDEQLGIAPGRVVIDVGAGTGKLTRALLPSGADVVAVEPVDAMRDVLMRQWPGVPALSATAEALPVADASSDAIVVGQAFHWFDGPRALAEFHRVLREGGRLGLIWNRRRLEQQMQQEIDEIIEPYRGDTPAYRGEGWRRPFKRGELFEEVATRTVPFEQRLDAEHVVDRVGSISFIAALELGPRVEVLDRVRRLAEARREPLEYVSDVFVFRRT
jgi:SAM-dependent methyltransferase